MSSGEKARWVCDECLRAAGKEDAYGGVGSRHTRETCVFCGREGVCMMITEKQANGIWNSLPEGQER